MQVSGRVTNLPIESKNGRILASGIGDALQRGGQGSIAV